MQAFVFPGQGSQFVGMGQELYKTFPCAREVFQEVDETLQQKLSQLIFNGPLEDLTLTTNTQPALMTVSLAVLRVLEKEGNLNLSKQVSYLAGHSLGEYSALTAAKALSLSDTAKLLRTRGQAMQSAVPQGLGAMAAILGLEADVINDIVKQAAQTEICTIANDNSPGQIVISGHTSAVERAMELAKDKGCKRAIPLPVSGPFHSPLMAPAVEAMQAALNQISFSAPIVPIICNVTAQSEEKPAALKQNLLTQITGQVRWRESITGLSELGVNEITELGAGKVLTGLIKRINPDLRTRSVQSPEDIELYLKETS